MTQLFSFRDAPPSGSAPVTREGGFGAAGRAIEADVDCLLSALDQARDQELDVYFLATREEV